MSHDHFIVRCKNCQAVISQCRCIGPKAIRWELCKKCADQDPGSDTVEVLLSLYKRWEETTPKIQHLWGAQEFIRWVREQGLKG